MFSSSEKFVGEGLTYDDVLLVPAYSEIIPRDVRINSYFSRNIPINIPIVSAAMDTVTEAKLAIAMAQEGGIGVLHKNMSIERQAAEIVKVKRAENGMIVNPITIEKGHLVKDALALMKEYSIGGIPVIDSNNKLIGIVTNRDLRFERDVNRPIVEIMTKNVISTPEFTDFEQAADILQEHRIEKLPVVTNDGTLVGLITYRDIIKLKERPNACKDKMGRLRVAAGIGITPNMYERIDAVVRAGADAIVVDTAHGHSKNVIDVVKNVRDKYPNIDIVCGILQLVKQLLHLLMLVWMLLRLG